MSNKINNPPDLIDRVVCISEDFIYTAQISSCFNKQNSYFAVLEPPRSLHKYWSNEFIMLSNLLAKIQPKKIIFCKVNKKIQQKIKKKLNLKSDRYEYIDNEIQLDSFVKRYKNNFVGELLSPPDRKKVAYALLEAKRNKLRLTIQEGVKYKIKHTKKSNYIVITDSVDYALPSILGNYAFAINADLYGFEYNIEHSPNEVLDILAEVRTKSRGTKMAQKLMLSTKKQLKLALDITDKYENITFFTNELLYGVFYPEKSTTHIYNKILPGHFLASSVSNPYILVASGLLVDTGFFKDSETQHIKKLLTKNKVHIKMLENNKFSNYDLDNAIQFYVYDLLHICSHAGLQKGTQYKINFTDKVGCKHQIVINIYDSFSPTNKGTGNDRMIEVKTFYEFVELDGQPWYSKRYKKGSSKTVVEDFLAIDRKNWRVIEKSEKVQMKHCNAIVTKDALGSYIPMIHSISDPISSPLVFNNACMSTYNLASNFIFAGAGFYIGTVNFVNSPFATKTAKYFYENAITKNMNLTNSLYEAQNKASVLEEYKVFATVGCHFRKLKIYDATDNSLVTKERLAYAALMRKKSLNNKNKELSKSVSDKHKDAFSYEVSELQKIN